MSETLLAAAQSGDADALQRALAEGADPLCATPYGATLLQLAIRAGAPSCVRLLIAAGAPVNEPDKARTASLLDMAISWSQEDCALALHEAGAVGKGNLRPLYFAIVGGQARLVKQMIKSDPGLLSETPGPDGLCGSDYLRVACEMAHSEMVALFLSAGVRPLVKSFKGHSPSLLSLFSYSDRRDEDIALCARLLIHAGADINQRFNDGERQGSALMFAAERGLPLTVNALLDLGADWTITDARGKNAEALAAKNEQWEARALIQARSAVAQERSELSSELPPLTAPSAARPRSAL